MFSQFASSHFYIQNQWKCENVGKSLPDFNSCFALFGYNAKRNEMATLVAATSRSVTVLVLRLFWSEKINISEPEYRTELKNTSGSLCLSVSLSLSLSLYFSLSFARSLSLVQNAPREQLIFSCEDSRKKKTTFLQPTSTILFRTREAKHFKIMQNWKSEWPNALERLTDFFPQPI